MIPLPLRSTLLAALLLPALHVMAAEDALTAALRTADDERVAATMAGDRTRLAAIYSDGLHYAHSNGKVDTKASQIEGIVAGPNRYEAFTYRERTFVPAGPGVALMKGRVVVATRNRASGQAGQLDLSYLAVWRQEGGQWRFFAWQSCRMPEAPAAAK